MLAAWKRFDLAPGESIGTAFGDFRVGAQVASGTVLDHRTVAADAHYGDIYTFGLTNGIPTLSSASGATRNQIQVFNGLDGPDAAAIRVTIYRDYAPWAGDDVPPQYHSAYTPSSQLFAYASKPITGGSSALVMEPVVGRFQPADPVMRLKITPSADGTTIQWASGAAK